MRRLVSLVCVGLAATSLCAYGQLAVQLRMERDTFLLYESVPVTVSIRNFSGRSIELSDQDGHPWLDFVVSDGNGRLMGAVGKPRVDEILTITPGQTATRTVDLLPLYELRERGTYQAQAVVIRNGTKVASQAVRFTIERGRELWSETAGLPPGDAPDENYRTYSLQIRRGNHYDMMYVCVEDRAHGVIYGAVPLGVYLALDQPKAQIDKNGHLHTLFRSGPQSFHYAQIDPQAKVVEQAIYSDVMSQPSLTGREDGTVLVSGGEKVYPREERAMTEIQAQPATPPQKKPKKSWWPFGRRASREQSVETNAPTTNFGPR